MLNWLNETIDEYVAKKQKEQQDALDKALDEVFEKAKERIENDFDDFGNTIDLDLKNTLLVAAERKKKALLATCSAIANTELLETIVRELVQQEIETKAQQELVQCIEKIKTRQKAELISEAVDPYPIVVENLDSLAEYKEVRYNRFIAKGTRTFTFLTDFERTYADLHESVLKYAKQRVVAKALVASRGMSDVDVIFIRHIEESVPGHNYKAKKAKLQYYTSIDVVFLSTNGKANLLENSQGVKEVYEDIVDPIEILGGELGV